MRLRFGLLGIAWSLTYFLASISANAGSLPDRGEKAAQERITAGYYRTLVIGMVDGDTSEIRSFGKLDDGRAPDGDTVYEIGSITKTFTATLLAEAVRAGRVTLDTPVAELLPDFTIPSRDGKTITLGEIATQHSGLPRLPGNMRPADTANPYADYDAGKLKSFLAGYELPRDPGAAYEYSNLGFGLLGYALAQSAGTTYGSLTEKEILAPLGMTTSAVALSAAMREHLATGHDESGKPTENWNFDALAGAGALYSTATDMLRYLKANMGLGSSPLTAAMQLAQEPRSDVAKRMRIGLAWMTTGRGIVWHNGGTGGYRSFLGFTADHRRGVVILTNTASSVDDLGFAALNADAPLQPVHQAVALPDALLDDYVGTYKLTDKLLLQVFRMKDGLYARASGQNAIPIFPSAPNEFFARVAGISATFTRDPGGVVTGLVLHQGGDHPAQRLSAAELPPELKEIALDAGALDSYVGRYQLAAGVEFTIVRKDDHLEAELTGQPALPIFANAKDSFFYKFVEAQLTFERGAGGAINAVVLHQNGRDLRAPRAAAR